MHICFFYLNDKNLDKRMMTGLILIDLQMVFNENDHKLLLLKLNLLVV